VREFVDAAATELGMHIGWEGEGANEKGYNAEGKCIVAVDPRTFRPTEVETLVVYTCGATRPRPRPNSAGRPRPASPSSWPRWCAKT